MVSYKAIFIIKMMTLWNFINDFYKNTKENCHNIYEYISDYISGYHDTWLFVSGHTIPISLNNLYNMIHVDWIYNNSSKSLRLNIEEKNKLIYYKFAWLSAKIRVINSNSSIEYNIDNFIEKFSLGTTNQIVPSLYIIFMCWCAYTKHWFCPDDIIEFHIIDNMGDELILNLEENNESLCIKLNKICLIIHTDEINKLQNNIQSDEKVITLIKDNKNKDN